MSRVATTGNSRPHVVHPGYQYTSRSAARLVPLEQPFRKLPLKWGMFVLVLGILGWEMFW